MFQGAKYTDCRWVVSINSTHCFSFWICLFCCCCCSCHSGFSYSLAWWVSFLLFQALELSLSLIFTDYSSPQFLWNISETLWHSKHRVNQYLLSPRLERGVWLTYSDGDGYDNDMSAHSSVPHHFIKSSPLSPLKFPLKQKSFFNSNQPLQITMVMK